MNCSQARRQQGFTLIELMVVVAIIGILAAIAIPKFATFKVAVNNAAAQSDLRNIVTAFTFFDTNYPNAVSATSPNDAILSSGVITKTVTLSEGVTVAILAASTPDKRCVFSKHTRGDTIMSANTDNFSVLRQPPEPSDTNIALGSATAYPAAQAVACGI